MSSTVMPVNDYYKKISTGYSGLCSDEISILDNGKHFPALDLVNPSDLINHDSNSTSSHNEDVINKENIDLEKAETPAITPINDYYRKILDEHSEIHKDKTSDFDVYAFYEALSVESNKGNYNNNAIISFSSCGSPNVGYSTLNMGPLPTSVVLQDNIDDEPVSMPDPCPCNVCGTVFSNNMDLIEHLQTHLSDEDSFQYPCSICGKHLRHKHTLRRHLRKLHKVPEDLITRYLEDSNQYVPSSKIIQESTMKHNGNIVNEVLELKENSQRPSVGPRHPPPNSNLVADYNPYEVDGETNNCHICRRILSNRIALKNHMFIQHGIDVVSENYFTCPFCHEQLENSATAFRIHLHEIHHTALHEHISMLEDDRLKVPSTVAVSLLDDEKDISNNNARHQVSNKVNNIKNNDDNITHGKLSQDSNNNNNNNSNNSNMSNSKNTNSMNNNTKSSSKGEFTCVYCDRSVCSKWSLKRHMLKVHKVDCEGNQLSSLHDKDSIENQTEEEQSSNVHCDPFRPKYLICHICQKQILCIGRSDMDMYMELRGHIDECHPDTVGNDSLTDTILPNPELDDDPNVEDNAISMLDIHL